MSRSLSSLLFALWLATGLFAAAPTTINYQGYLQDSSGNDINGTKSIVFSLYTVASGGTNIWTSTKDVNVTNGVYSTVLGDTVALSGLAFDTQYYLGINVAGDGEMVPRQPLTGTAYANTAKKIDTAYSLPAADGTSGQVLQTNGSGTVSWQTPVGGLTVYYYKSATSPAASPNNVYIGCTQGKPIGGGCEVDPSAGDASVSTPATDATTSAIVNPTGWRCAAWNLALTAYVVCAE